MRKYSLLLIFTILFALGTHAQESELDENYCERLQQRNDARRELRPFKYTSYKATRIALENFTQREEVNFRLFHKTRYRFVWSKGKFPKDIKISVYERPSQFNNRIKLFEGTIGEEPVIFDTPEKLGTDEIFIQYEIPHATMEAVDFNIRGCMVMIIGYLVNPDDLKNEEGNQEALNNIVEE